jgi:hypothetical protein
MDFAGDLTRDLIGDLAGKKCTIVAKLQNGCSDNNFFMC